jgi:exosortase
MTAKTWKTMLFLFAAVVAAALSYQPLLTLMRGGPHRDYYTHIPLVPLISAYVFFLRRKKLVREEPGSPLAGLAVLILGAGLVLVDLLFPSALVVRAELRTSGSILIAAGTFLALFGPAAVRNALFPFLFLLFTIPLPLAWMKHVVSILVTASTGFTHLLFLAFGVPFIQEGSLFRLPDFDILVAQECSGIRSSLALLITSVLAAQMFLNRPWKKVTLALAVFPVTVFKNAARIVTLYLLSYFVDMRIIQGGFLHKSGGFIFFGLGMVMLALILWLLRSPGEAWEWLMGRLPPPTNKT